jgi:hypothetical protein
MLRNLVFDRHTGIELCYLVLLLPRTRKLKELNTAKHMSRYFREILLT